MAEAKPLSGKRIAVTRARHQAPPLAAIIRDFGGEPVAYPCIAIAPPADQRPLDDCLRRLAEFDWLLLTSGNTARAIAERLPALGIQLAATGIQAAAAGPATAAEARRRLSCEVQHVPAEYGAGHLARSLPLGEPCRVLLPQSDLAGASAAAVLRARGADVTTVVAYRTIMGAGGADLPAMISRWRNPRAHLHQPIGARLLSPALPNAGGAWPARRLHRASDIGGRPRTGFRACNQAAPAQPARHDRRPCRFPGFLGGAPIPCRAPDLVEAHQFQVYYLARPILL